jgi:hypothetical protein
MPYKIKRRCTAHAPSSHLISSPGSLGVYFWAGRLRGFAAHRSQIAHGKTGLIVHGIVFNRGWGLSKYHFAFESFEIRVHCERQSKRVGEEFLGGDFAHVDALRMEIFN